MTDKEFVWLSSTLIDKREIVADGPVAASAVESTLSSQQLLRLEAQLSSLMKDRDCLSGTSFFRLVIRKVILRIQPRIAKLQALPGKC